DGTQVALAAEAYAIGLNTEAGINSGLRGYSKGKMTMPLTPGSVFFASSSTKGNPYDQVWLAFYENKLKNTMNYNDFVALFIEGAAGRIDPVWGQFRAAIALAKKNGKTGVIEIQNGEGENAAKVNVDLNVWFPVLNAAVNAEKT
ncbi:MAG: hypothetical protein HQL26_11200, partial [Candidatus Omnitrophica bacterium]|nr:hypothetical protein [Candidatus Omnitrophota bacterium]